jgi:hypothetical protein
MRGRIVDYDCGEAEQELGAAEPDIMQAGRSVPRNRSKRTSAIDVSGSG